MRKNIIFLIIIFCFFNLNIFSMQRRNLCLCHSSVIRDGNHFIACLENRIEWGELKGILFIRPKRYQISYDRIQGANL